MNLVGAWKRDLKKSINYVEEQKYAGVELRILTEKFRFVQIRSRFLYFESSLFFSVSNGFEWIPVLVYSRGTLQTGDPQSMFIEIVEENKNFSFHSKSVRINLSLLPVRVQAEESRKYWLRRLVLLI